MLLPGVERGHGVRSILLIVLAAWTLPIFAWADAPVPIRTSPVLWGELEPGSYAVGFKVLHQRDASRIYRSEKGPVGEHDPVQRLRPLRVSVWYPAIPSSSQRISYGDYVRPPRGPAADKAVEDLLSARELSLLRRIIRTPEAVNQLLNTAMAAQLNARAAPGRFPLIVYAAGLNEALQHGNFVMAEYLAAHGYVVATVPQLATTSLRMNLRIDPADLETQTRDLEYALGLARGLSFVDPSSTAVMGHSMGGVAALLLQMRNPDVDAVVGLDASYGGALVSELKNSPFYRPEEMRVPLLDARSANPEWDLSAIDTFQYSRRYYLELSGVQHADFTSYPELAFHFPTDMEGRTPQTASRVYELLCRAVLAFLDASLRNDPVGGQRLEALVRDNPAVAKLRRREPISVPVSANELAQIVMRIGLISARKLYSELRSEAVLNTVGYRLLEFDKDRLALEAFTLNVKLHPASTNAQDSLADAYLSLRREQLARKAYKRLLSVLPKDGALTPEARKRLDENARARLRNLERK